MVWSGVTVANQLLPIWHDAGKLLRQSHSASFGASIDRRAAAADFVRNRGAKAPVSAAGRSRRDFGIRAHGNKSRLGSCENGNAGGANARRRSLHPQWRKALVHAWRKSGRDPGEGEVTVANGEPQTEKPDHCVRAGDGHARHRGGTSLPVYGPQGPL